MSAEYASQGWESAAASSQPPQEDTFKILVATDIHLGAYEKHLHRHQDSFTAFEEILQKGVEQEVDFILLCGDLFDENKPSHATLYKAMELIRQYCMGDRGINFSVVSDQTTHFGGKFRRANYEDPNLNVAIPVFMIHGNHDDPTGAQHLSAVDLLSVCGLVNYFGKVEDFRSVDVSPILLEKGCTRLALYGLGWIPDERLNRLFHDRKVTFLRPKEATSDWFNLFCIHQNRHPRGLSGLDRQRCCAVTDEMLRGFFDLVIWGHEHECIQEPLMVQDGDRSFDILQPGSSIVTSLSVEEAKPKHCCVLEVWKTQYKVSWHALQSTRPFYIEDVVLANEGTILDKTLKDVKGFLMEKVDYFVQKCHDDRTFPPALLKTNPSLPLPMVRLRVDYSGGYPEVSPLQFGREYTTKVANATEILHPMKARKAPGQAVKGEGAVPYKKAEQQDLKRMKKQHSEAEASEPKPDVSDDPMFDLLRGLAPASDDEAPPAAPALPPPAATSAPKPRARAPKGAAGRRSSQQPQLSFKQEPSSPAGGPRAEVVSSDEDAPPAKKPKPAGGRGRGAGRGRAQGGGALPGTESTPRGSSTMKEMFASWKRK